MRVLAAVALGLACVAAGAQVPGQGECTPGVNVFAGVAMAGTSPKAGPYVATVKTTFEQRLIDGDVITGELLTRAAQNSNGWTRQEFSSLCERDEEGTPRLRRQVMVWKPKPRENINWTEGWQARKEATLTRPIPPTPEQQAAQLAKMKAATAEHRVRPAERPEARETKTESLGTANIAGVEATGTRMVRTIPPGEEGNSIPLVVTTEMWRTRDGLVARYLSDDPRRGRTVSELQEIVRGEPDAALFAPPEGYEVKEAVPMQEKVLVEATVRTP